MWPRRSEAAIAPPMRLTFVILCLGRTGSTHLQSLLDSHPDVRCFGELFTHNAHTFDDVFLASEHDDAVEYLREVTGSVEEPVVGFKLPVNSIRAHEQVLEIFRQPSLRVIRLSRRNLLALYVSRRLLATTRVPQSTHGSYGETRLRLDPQQALGAFRRMEEHERWLDDLAEGHPTFALAYEDLIGGSGLDGLQGFLGVEPRPLESHFEKLRTRPLEETVENWDELVEALRGTRYEAFLVEGP